MKIKTLFLAVGLTLALPAFAQDRGYQTDAATVDAIRAAAKQFASAAESVRGAMETHAPEPKAKPSAPTE